MMSRAKRALLLMRKYPTIALSFFIVLLLVAGSVYAMMVFPLKTAIPLWNEPHDEWRDNPQYAQPVWTNWFRRADLPTSIIVPIGDQEPIVEMLSETSRRETTVVTFEYDYTTFPTEDVDIVFDIEFYRKIPMLTLIWIRPDGSEVELRRGTIRGGDTRLPVDPLIAFGSTEDTGDEPLALPGMYTLRAEAMIFEDEPFSFTGDIIVYGRVYGIAGTDDHRRDLGIGLFWGLPIALSTGVIASLVITVLGFVFAAIGAWYGGWVDEVIQRITEVCMMIPFLPCILIVMRYVSASIWVLLIYVIGFRIFSGPLKYYRAMFLQLLHSQYVEAARAYGASDMRIVFRYLLPRILPVLVPRFILGVPLFVFLEASIALMGRSDSVLPTWGKILSESRVALYMGHYYWVLQPVFLLLITGVAFSLLGYTLDRILNPRLRDI